MGILLNRSEYFRSLASGHLQLAHDMPLKKSFIRLNDKREADAAIWQNAGRHLLVHDEMSERLPFSGATLRRVISQVLVVLSKPTQNGDATALETAKDIALQIAEDIAARITHDVSIGNCPEIEDVDHIQIDEAEEYGPGYVGWRLSFTETPNDNFIRFDETKWKENIFVTQQTVPLVDEDGGDNFMPE